MKKVLMLFALLFVGVQIAVAQEKEPISKDQVPKEINNYVDKHFAGIGIGSAFLDQENTSAINYDVKLNDGTELEFDSSYKIIEIERKKALPESVVSASIKQYVAQTYPKAEITEWSCKNVNRQEIGLNNNVDLIFDKDGKFISVDK